jgi:hypothetical protein
MLSPSLAVVNPDRNVSNVPGVGMTTNIDIFPPAYGKSSIRREEPPRLARVG